MPQTLDSGRFDTATRSYSLTRSGQSRDTSKRYHSNPRSLIRHHSSTLHPPRYVSRSQSARVSAFKPLTFTARGNPGARYHHHDAQSPLFGGDDGYDPDDYHEGGLMRASSSALCRPHISSRVAARVSWYEEERGPHCQPPVRAAHALHVQITFCTCRYGLLTSDAAVVLNKLRFYLKFRYIPLNCLVLIQHCLIVAM